MGLASRVIVEEGADISLLFDKFLVSLCMLDLCYWFLCCICIPLPLNYYLLLLAVFNIPLYPLNFILL